MTEKRKYRRLGFDAYVILDYVMCGRAKNISCGGICVAIPTPVEKGTIIHASFTLPGSKGLSIVSSIAWMRKDKDGKYLCGLEFIDFHNNDEAVLFKYMSARAAEIKELTDLQDDLDLVPADSGESPS